jgi:hypothetical protein
MAGFEVARLVQNPLGQLAPPGERGDIVRVTNGRATIYLDPSEYERMSEAGVLYLLAQADTRPTSEIWADTPAGGRGMTIHDAYSRAASPRDQVDQNVLATPQR